MWAGKDAALQSLNSFLKVVCPNQNQNKRVLCGFWSSEADQSLWKTNPRPGPKPWPLLQKIPSFFPGLMQFSAAAGGKSLRQTDTPSASSSRHLVLRPPNQKLNAVPKWCFAFKLLKQIPAQRQGFKYCPTTATVAQGPPSASKLQKFGLQQLGGCSSYYSRRPIKLLD